MKSCMPAAPDHAMPAPRAARRDEDGARERLLLAGLRLFAEQGYAKTSIRQIGLAANANVASVSYYFGNKAGLYRAVFWGAAGPLSAPGAAPDAAPDAASFSLPLLFERMLEPLKSGAQARLWIKLHRREMIEPTGLWQQKINQGMQPMHAALVASLCERLGIDQPDDEVQALATLIVGPAVHLLVNCEVIDILAPQLLQGAAAVDRWCERLLANAESLIRAEHRRRRADKASSSARRGSGGARKPPAVGSSRATTTRSSRRTSGSRA
jgi:AcrR family transcriptional regulator